MLNKDGWLIEDGKVIADPSGASIEIGDLQKIMTDILFDDPDRFTPETTPAFLQTDRYRK